MSEGTEKPTPKRVREARRKGQLPRSRIWTTSVGALAGLGTLIFSAPSSGSGLRRWTQTLLASTEVAPSAALLELAGQLARLAGPPLSAAALASVAASVALSGLSLQPAGALPKLERVDPAAGLRKLFTTRGLAEAAKAAAVLVLFTWVLWAGGADAIRGAAGALARPGLGSLWASLLGLERLVWRCLWVLLLVGGLDFLLAHRRHLRELRMTQEEVKREHKQSEGDPRHKAQRRSLHRQLAAGGPARGVASANAVVVNPTHVAVALRYSPEECGAPYLVAKGLEGDALAIRRQAAAAGIPIVKDVPLARALVRFDVGEPVPEELYRAAAGVLAAALDAGVPAPDSTRRDT